MNETGPSKKIRQKIASLDVDGGSPFLVLGNLSTDGKIVGGKYPINDAMAARLRDAAKANKAKAATYAMSPYDGATVLAPREGLWVPSDRISDAAPLLRFLATVDDQEDLTPLRLRTLAISFYAIGFGPDSDRVFFVRQNASRILATTKILGVIQATMRPVNASLVSLDTSSDFILTDVGAAVFDAAAFERFIQDPVEVAGHFAASIDALDEKLPFAASVMADLKAKGAKSVMMRGRVRSIMGRPYFEKLTMKQIRKKIEEKGLDSQKYIAGGKFVFKTEDTMFILKLLDQKVWTGDFDDTLYSTNAAALEER
jgi:hypothetical protein